MNFIFVSLQRINTDRESTSTSLAKELAKKHKVLYVNPPIDRKSWVFKSDDVFMNKHIQLIKQRKAGVEKAENNLWILNSEHIIESINWIPVTSLFMIFNKVNNRIFAKDIKAAIEEIGLKEYIIINDKDIFRSFYLKELLKPILYIYLDRDYTIGFKYWQRHGIKLEPLLMQKADAIVCNSTDFTMAAKMINANSFYIENGANLELFNSENKETEPIELRSLKRPLIGYVGALTSKRLDLNLLIHIAENLNQGTLVLIGPQDENFERSKLHQLNNVHHIDKKDTKYIPSYLKYFDVCINPQVINKITIGNFPLKIIEYLSMGKPVVATATNTMKEVFSEYVYLAESNIDFMKKIDIAVESDTILKRQKRTVYAQRFSWKNVSDNLLNVINKLKRT